MWVCHCRAVSDAKILQAIAAGAENESDIGRVCGAGTACGSCHDELRRLRDAARLSVSASSRTGQDQHAAGHEDQLVGV
jgi:bacterioferritin-associated ferredoxin